MRTTRQTTLRRTLLEVLTLMPVGILTTDRLLRADATRLVAPRPTTAELDAEIAAADTDRLLVGVQGEDAVKWKITDAGRARRVINLLDGHVVAEGLKAA